MKKLLLNRDGQPSKSFILYCIYVSVYDVLTGQIEKTLPGHRACVRDVSWHPTRQEIISTSVSISVAKCIKFLAFFFIPIYLFN
jgi:WD40 repeat protein